MTLSYFRITLMSISERKVGISPSDTLGGQFMLNINLDVKRRWTKKKAIYIIIYIYKWLISYSYYIKQFRMGVVKSAGWSFLDNLNLF